MIFGLSGPAEDATRLYNEARGILLRIKSSGKTVPAYIETIVTKSMTAYYNYFKANKYTPEQYNTLMRRAYDSVVPKLKDIASGALVVPAGTPTAAEEAAGITEGQINVLGVGIDKKWIVYGGAGLGIIILLSFLKGKK